MVIHYCWTIISKSPSPWFSSLEKHSNCKTKLGQVRQPSTGNIDGKSWKSWYSAWWERHVICHMYHMQCMCKFVLHFEGAFLTLYVCIILVFGIIQSYKEMIKYGVILQVKDWDIILILGLETLNCHIKGTRNVAIYAFSSGKFLNVRICACVKDLTNIMYVMGI